MIFSFIKAIKSYSGRLYQNALVTSIAALLHQFTPTREINYNTIGR